MIKTQSLILRKDDYELMMRYLRSGQGRNRYDQENAIHFEKELQKADIVEKEDFPADTIRLNSLVRIMEMPGGKVRELTLVIPEHANVREGKISLLAPVGTALIGFSKGQQVDWQVPSGKKTFKILEVVNT
ncbi:MAG TPA: GreA/GreB family elongation factor [Chitinophagaceae bacterium]|nr:GreA/GreB family elongation factor [Chitinophagaceae bacterium]